TFPSASVYSLRPPAATGRPKASKTTLSAGAGFSWVLGEAPAVAVGTAVGGVSAATAGVGGAPAGAVGVAAAGSGRFVVRRQFKADASPAACTARSGTAAPRRGTSGRH